MQPTVANASNRCKYISQLQFQPPSKSAVFPKIGSCASYASYASCASYVRYVSEEKDIRRKSNGFELLPPPAGGPPPSRREVWGFRRSRPSALPSIAYRGFAVAPMTLRAPSRNPLYNSGSRVATLVVSMGVMGFLGDLRGRNRNLPLIP